ncbi:hypothetical protein [Nostoc sp.]|uniref:hypothetical protein n=1 Tax=Nostoc sp. TaxID=1180 RepID=UPI002FF5D784
MTADEAVKTWLEEIYLVYREIQVLKKRLEEIQTVELARAEYEKCIGEEETKLRSLKEQKLNLQVEQRLLTTDTSESKPNINLPKHKSNNLIRKKPESEIKVLAKCDETTKNKLRAKARNKFKRFLSRNYQYKLETSVLGQINCIADDVDRPLGEALALLDWSIFEDYANRTDASDTSGLEQLNELGNELQEYRKQLSGKVDMLELSFRDWLGIWEKWRSREQSPEQSQAWETFIAKTQRAKQDEAAKLQDDILQLEEKNAQIKAVRNQIET